MYTLRQCLSDNYCEAADMGFGGPDENDVFMIDDGGKGRAGTPGKPHAVTCQVVARVRDADTVSVCLRWDALQSNEIRTWALRVGASISTLAGVVIEFPVGRRTVEFLNELAGLIEAMIGPNAPPYSMGAYSYICRRTSRAIRRLAMVLHDYWRV